MGNRKHAQTTTSHVSIFTETWAENNITEILGSHAIMGRKSGKEGGVAIAIHDKYRYKTTHINETIIQVQIENPPCTIMGAYTPHNAMHFQERQSFWSSISKTLDDNNQTPIIIIGDLNAGHEKSPNHHQRTSLIAIK